MTPEELAAMRARVAAATSGPLFVINRGTAHDYDIDAPIASPFHGYTRGMFWRKEDAEFYAAAREDIPALLDEVERLRAMLRQLEWRHEYAEEMWPDGLKECVVCHNRKMNGHAIGCALAALLSEEES